MATTTVGTLNGSYQADPIHSVFGFSVLHSGISTYRGTFDDVIASLEASDDKITLAGAAQVDSISIREPEQFRAHVLGEEFFDAEKHPEVTFRSTSVDLSEDGRARVEGELTIAGTTRGVTAAGTYKGPIQGADAERVALELETTFDRRDFGFDWQMELPGGGQALGWDVTLTIHLELAKSEEA